MIFLLLYCQQHHPGGCFHDVAEKKDKKKLYCLEYVFKRLVFNVCSLSAYLI